MNKIYVDEKGLEIFDLSGEKSVDDLKKEFGSKQLTDVTEERKVKDEGNIQIATDEEILQKQRNDFVDAMMAGDTVKMDEIKNKQVATKI